MDAKPPPLYAAFGELAAASVLTSLMNAAFAAAGLRGADLPFRADERNVADLFARLCADGLAGAHFLSPCAEAAVALCDRLSPEAEALAAVDTVRLDDDAVIGSNAAPASFARALAELDVDVAGRPVLVLGVEPESRAAGRALERAGAAVTYAAADLTAPRPGLSTRATVIRLAEAARFAAEKRPALTVEPIGPQADAAPPLDVATLPPEGFVWTFAVGAPSPLFAAARSRGLAAADGIPFLLHRAAHAFQEWTGREAPHEIIRRAAEQARDSL
jgi:shikimate dehydrogenase